MTARIRNMIARAHAALRNAVRIGRAARYTALNGPLAAQLAAGQLIQASTHLRALGLNEQGVRSTRSHYGKKVKAAFQAATGRDPLMAWALVDDHWRRVCVYHPGDPALAAGVAAYPRLAALIPSPRPHAA